MPCIFEDTRAITGLRQELDQSEPGWTEREIPCRFHRTHHVLTRDLGQVPLAAIPQIERGTPLKRGTLPPIPKGKDPATWCRWHETSSLPVYGHCDWCRTDRLHVHRDALGTVRSGRAGQGYLVERCPACHRYNAVLPVYGTRANRPAIRASRLEGDTPVIQLTMGGVR